jgi:hypothetical protein
VFFVSFVVKKFYHQGHNTLTGTSRALRIVLKPPLDSNFSLMNTRVSLLSVLKLSFLPVKMPVLTRGEKLR